MSLSKNNLIRFQLFRNLPLTEMFCLSIKIFTKNFFKLAPVFVPALNKPRKKIVRPKILHYFNAVVSRAPHKTFCNILFF